MGERKKDALRVNFDRKLKLEFHGVKVTSDAGLLAYRELDNVFGLTNMVASELVDKRTGKNTQHSLLALLRQSVFNRLAGYDGTNDAERLMPRIAEKLEFMKVRAVTVCARAGIGRKVGHKKTCFHANFQ